ncbi:MAG: polymer-forming cytoskeletal protein [Acidobacteriota bacterium]
MWKKDEEPLTKPGTQQFSSGPSTPSAAAASSASREPEPGSLERAVVGASIKINGELGGSEDLLIQGQVDGKIDLAQHTVTIGRSGRISADVFAKTVHVEGEVRGNLFAAEQIVVHKTGSVNGNLASPRISLEDGCKFKGNIDMDPQAADPRAKSTRPNLPPPIGERPLTAIAK